MHVGENAQKGADVASTFVQGSTALKIRGDSF